MGITIRRAAVEDLDAVHRLQTELTKYEAILDILLKNDERAYAEEREDYGRLLNDPNQIFFLAERGNVAVGYIYGYIEKAPEWIKEEKVGYLSDAFVMPDFRGQGIMRSLVDQILTYFKSEGIRRVTLDVYANNDPSIKIWESLGFRPYMIEMSKNL